MRKMWQMGFFINVSYEINVAFVMEFRQKKIQYFFV